MIERVVQRALAVTAPAHVAFGHLISLSLAPPLFKSLQLLISLSFLSFRFLY
jgi:hypothetical protein